MVLGIEKIPEPSIRPSKHRLAVIHAIILLSDVIPHRIISSIPAINFRCSKILRRNQVSTIRSRNPDFSFDLG